MEELVLLQTGQITGVDADDGSDISLTLNELYLKHSSYG
ncbi:hypothetical protein A2U01_0033532, partial [Trifolium medium]|nr:hypothetical protein [Trifolium medium]